MKSVILKSKQIIKDEQASEAVEVALILGLIVVAAIALMSVLGNKIVTRWINLSTLI